MHDGDMQVQRELFKETRSAKMALEEAMNIEMGIQNQLKMSGTAIHQNTNDITTTSINNVQSSWNRSRPVTNNFIKPKICPTLAMVGQQLIDKIFLLVGKTAELQTILQKYVESLNNI